jgi:hypothetical protein
MSIECEVILGKIDVNQWLKEHDFRPVHAKLDNDDVQVLERSDVKAALLGEHNEGIANVILIVPSPTGPQALRVSLALLENICEGMRRAVGPDGRLIDETDGD